VYEHHTDRLLSRRAFLQRLANHGLLVSVILVASLAIGTAGFHWMAEQAWIDAFLNAAMLLGGMGPIGTFEHTSGKLFAAFYALYAGIAFLVVWAILIAPVAHRILHRMHLAEHPKR
jgi:hypothetical protein